MKIVAISCGKYEYYKYAAMVRVPDDQDTRKDYLDFVQALRNSCNATFTPESPPDGLSPGRLRHWQHGEDIKRTEYWMAEFCQACCRLACDLGRDDLTNSPEAFAYYFDDYSARLFLAWAAANRGYKEIEWGEVHCRDFASLFDGDFSIHKDVRK